MGGSGPNTGTGGSNHNPNGHHHEHKHTPEGTPTGQPITVSNTQPESFHPIQLTLKPDTNNNYYLEPITRNIPSFPSTLGAGFKICLGLKEPTESPVKFEHGEKVDNKLIYASVYISNKGDITETILGKQRTGYKVGLILSAGGGVFQLGPVYSILSREPNGLYNLAINVDSPALIGQATITLLGKGSNSCTLDARFTGNGGLWKGILGKTYTLN